MMLMQPGSMAARGLDTGEGSQGTFRNSLLDGYRDSIANAPRPAALLDALCNPGSRVVRHLSSGCDTQGEMNKRNVGHCTRSMCSPLSGHQLQVMGRHRERWLRSYSPPAVCLTQSLSDRNHQGTSTALIHEKVASPMARLLYDGVPPHSALSHVVFIWPYFVRQAVIEQPSYGPTTFNTLFAW